MTTAVLQVGDQAIQADKVLSLLHRYQVMPQLLRGMVIDEAIAPFGCTDEERSAGLLAFEEHQQITSTEAREAWLQRHGMTLEQLEELALRPIRIEKFKAATWGHKAESHFLRRKRDLDQVVYSLIRTKDFGQANELYFRLLEGEQSFEDLARHYSQGPEARSGGILGPAPLSQPHPAIAKLLISSQPGKVLAPRMLGEWVVIVRLEKLIPAVFDQAMSRRMVDEMFEFWLQEQVQKQMNRE
jgi:parvulin-like peptidyl-prolyl isomerase